jgi:hypothetical protein
MWALLIAAAMLYPAISGFDVHIKSFPPLRAEWMPRVGVATIAAVVLAVLAVRYAGAIALRASWGALLGWTFAGGLAWMLALALVDGLSGIGTIFDTSYEYLRTARSVTDIGTMLREFVSRIPLDVENNWAVHVAGHPPGALLFFVVLVRIGLGSGLAAGFVVTVIGATTAVAVLITLRRLGAEQAARCAAPLIALGPAAIWMAVSADAMFAAVAAWGLCALAFAATARSRVGLVGCSVAAGLLLGYCVMLSYGLPLLGVAALAILWLGGRWSPLPWAVGAALAVVLAFAAAGFVWWEAYPVLVERYYDGIQQHRAYGYWIWANLAALGVSAGPAIFAGAAVVLARLRGFGREAGADRVVVVLAMAAIAMIVIADVSGMSKAEVERIWLPFIPWLAVGTSLLSEAWRRWGLAGSLVFAIVVQHLLFIEW